MFQNKMHYAITGNATAEIIVERASDDKSYMGLKTWLKAPAGKILKSDIRTAKNYFEKCKPLCICSDVSKTLEVILHKTTPYIVYVE